MKTTPPKHRDAPAIDSDLLALMDAALVPSAQVDTALHARVKQKLLRRIAADSTAQHLHLPPDAASTPNGAAATAADTAAASETAWQDFGPGLRIKVLHHAQGVMSYLLRLAPGAALPAHRHPIDEECVVIEGEVQIGPLNLGAGGFHLGRKDVLHDRLQSRDGALIFLRGAVPEAALAL
jgi:hypothetical protein